MHLRQQALIVLVGACCCAGGGCARLLAPFLAPQQAAMSAANQVANRATGPLQNELGAMDREVSRLLEGKRGEGFERLTYWNVVVDAFFVGTLRGDCWNHSCSRAK
ncbi:MAG: hypothetical protein J0M02_16865 [Planctomycetes bacterium]|nr:hypothetical protein [Planctomycetota bacterium]